MDSEHVPPAVPPATIPHESPPPARHPAAPGGPRWRPGRCSSPAFSSSPVSLGRLAELPGVHASDQCVGRCEQVAGATERRRRGESATTAETVAHLQEESAAARSAVEDPVYGAAARLPWLGPNLAAVREVSVTVDRLATDVLPSLVDVASSLRPADLAPSGGNRSGADRAGRQPVAAADEAVVASREAIDQIDRSELIAPIGEAVQACRTSLPTQRCDGDRCPSRPAVATDARGGRSP